MPFTREAQDAREADTVRSAPGRTGLYVPTVEHVIANLERIRKILRSDSCTDAYKQRCREDGDALLDRLSLLRRARRQAEQDEAQQL